MFARYLLILPRTSGWRSAIRCYTSQTIGSSSSITCDELMAKLSSSKPILVDVRESPEFSQGNIKGSVNIPVQKVTEAFQADDKAFQQLYHCKKPIRSDEVIFYCKVGIRSEKASGYARTLGYQARNLIGGYDAWKALENSSPKSHLCDIKKT